jgi:hypothetical protein
MHALRRAALAAILTLIFAICGPTTVLADDGSFRTADNPGGGSITTGTVGSVGLPVAVAALMRRVGAEIGSRPSIVQAVQNTRDRSVALLFSADRDGTPYTGVAIVTASPGVQASGAALYDTAARFHTTLGPMLRRLQGMTTPMLTKAPSQHRAIVLAPPEPLVAHPFADGTGSISVPSDWVLPVATGGSVSANAPGGVAQVSYNMHYTGVDPSNPRAQMFLRTATPLARANLHGAVLPYTDDAVKAWVGMYTELGKEHGFETEIHVTSSTPSGSAADFSGTLGSGSKMVHFIAHAFVLPPNPNGLWGISDSHIFVNDAVLARQASTANAVLGSARINFGAVAAQEDAIRKSFQQRFEAEIANDREQDEARVERTDEALANDRTAQEGMHKQAVAMENYSLDRAVVVNATTGVHDTVDSGFADALVRDNPNYQKVSTSNLLRGVDY